MVPSPFPVVPSVSCPDAHVKQRTERHIAARRLLNGHIPGCPPACGRTGNRINLPMQANDTVMKKANQHQKQSANEVHPRFCAHCGFAFPMLQRAEQTKYRYCPGCQKPVQWGGHQWANIMVDDQGVIFSDEASPGFVTVEKGKLKCVDFLAHTPGGVLISGIALATLGYGFVLAAVPLAIAGTAVAAAGAAVIQTAMIGGVVMGLIIVCSGKGEGLGGVLMLSGVVALGGGAMVLAGALTIAVAGAVGVLGPILISAGAIAVGAVGCHQLYLQNQKHDWSGKAKAALSGIASKDKTSAQPRSLSGVEDPWAGINALKLPADILDVLRKAKQN